MMRVTKQTGRTAAFAATLLLGFVASGCAKESSEKNLRASSQELPQAVAPVPSAAVPLAEKDCPSAQRYRDNICELAKRICGLQADPGGNASAGGAGTGDYCKDAQTRCDEAKQRWQADCE